MGEGAKGRVKGSGSVRSAMAGAEPILHADWKVTMAGPIVRVPPDPPKHKPQRQRGKGSNKFWKLETNEWQQRWEKRKKES